MEILTYVIEGGLEHRDSMGNGSVIGAGEFQRMTAGSGVTHSEVNHSADETVHLLQIWILPRETNLAPGYEQKSFGDRRNTLRLVASPDGRGGALTIHQDVSVYSTVLDAGTELVHTLEPGRYAWAQVVRGILQVNGRTLAPGDGAAVSDETSVTLHADEEAEVLLFDLS
jgi:hypothetical protein